MAKPKWKKGIPKNHGFYWGFFINPQTGEDHWIMINYRGDDEQFKGMDYYMEVELPKKPQNGNIQN